MQSNIVGRRWAGGLVAIGMALLSHKIFAEEPASAGDSLEEVTVTAQKRTQNLQGVPIAATALTTDALSKRFIRSFTDIGSSTPNTSLEAEGLSNYASSFYIRGQGTQNRGPFVDPAVTVVVDGVAGGNIATALSDFLDIEAIEVLRGPQGTLQGRNSTGGAIIVRHKPPDPSAFSANVGVQLGNAGRREFSGVVNLPMPGYRAAFRLAAKRASMDGFFKNVYSGEDVGGEDRWSFLPSIRVDGENWDLTVRGLFNRYDDESSTLVPRYACRADPRLIANTPLNDTYINTIALRVGGAEALRYCAHEPDRGLFTIDQNRPIEMATLDQDNLTFEFNRRFRDVGTLTLIGNHQRNAETSALDVDGTALQLNSNLETTKHDQQSMEMRFASEFSDGFAFVAGIFWLDQHYNLRRQTSVDSGAGTPTPVLRALFNGSTQGNTQSAAFAQAEWNFTDALTGVAGARYTRDTKDIGVCATITVACDRTRLLRNGASWTDVSPRLGLNWRLDERKFLYGYWARGFRAGGFNGEAGSAAAAGPFDPEQVETFEVGAKLDFERRLRLNLAAFHTDATDLQRQLARATSLGTAEIVTQNAAAGTFRGAEIEIIWQPVESFRLEVSVGYLHAKYTHYCTDLNGTAANDPSLVACAPPIVVAGGMIEPVDLTGLPIARAPDWTTRYGGQYTLGLVEGGAVELSAEYTRQGKQLTLDSGAPQGTTLGITNFDGTRLDPFRQSTSAFNASLGYRAPRDRWRVSLYGKNLTDSIWFRRLSFASPTLSFGTLADPREYGLSFQYDFNE